MAQRAEFRKLAIMLVQRQRTLRFAGLALVVVWVLALTGYFIARNAKMTAAKVRAYAESVDLSKLPAAERAQAIHKLAGQINALPYDERQRARFDRVGMRWFDQMTDPEKGDFIEQTLPTGFRQMIAAFEQMPEDKRRQALDDSLKRLREAREKLQTGELPAGADHPPRHPLWSGMREKLQSGEVPAGGVPGGPPPPGISPELQERVKTIGLRAYFTQSSAQTKAELAPLLEELQRVIELGGRPPHRQ